MVPRASLVLALLLAAVPLHALQVQDSQDRPPEKTMPAEQKPSDDGRPRSSAPAGTFKPSEKIEADSAVSFPVDI
jgi:hypothetical protein